MLEKWAHPVCGDREDGMVTLLPFLHDTDGFFIAKMRKKA
jgi:16S rRNA (cytosine967-C5)-methyltransferase